MVEIQVIRVKDSGSNHLDNRALLCHLRNITKGNRLKRDADHPINLREKMEWSQDYLMWTVRGVPQQLTLGQPNKPPQGR